MKKELVMFMPTLQIGGVEKNFFILANNLSNKLDLTVITTSKIKNKLNKKINFICPNFSFIEKLNDRFRFIICLYYLLKKIISNPKILVISFQGNMYSVFLCKLFNIKIILRLNSSPKGWSKNFLKNLIFKFGLKLADGLVVNSLEFKNQIKKKYNVKSKCIYNPLNSKEIIRLSKEKIKFNFFKKKSLNLINVARLDDQKDHITLIRAIDKIKNEIDVKLLIIGIGPNENIIKNFIKFKNLKKIIKIKKNIKNPFPYILRSDLFILSSIFEGLPNVLLESLTLNRFIISSNCPTGPSEILSYGKGGILFKIGDYKDLGKKIIFYKKNKFQLRKKLIYAKKNLYRFNFQKNINSYYKYLIKFYN